MNSLEFLKQKATAAELCLIDAVVAAVRAEIADLKPLPIKSQDSAGYRMLEPGEEIHAGDEFQRDLDNAWVRCGLIGHLFDPTIDSPVRRPIPTPPPAEPQYRELHPGEIRQQGDQFLNCFTEDWEDCQSIGHPIREGVLLHRRPISLDPTPASGHPTPD